MEKEHPGNVTQLNAYRKSHLTERQQVVREHLIEAAARPPHEASTAVVGLSVQPNGHIRTVVLQIEPEHVIPILSAMRVLTRRLESCLTDSFSAKHLLIVGLIVAFIAADSIEEPAIAEPAVAAFNH